MELTKTYSDIAEYGEKYHFYSNAANGTVVCMTLYKGKIVRGTAKCSPEDDFDIAIGKRLAYLRCRQKFFKKKFKQARNVYGEAVIENARAINNLYKARDFMNDAETQYTNANNELTELEAGLSII